MRYRLTTALLFLMIATANGCKGLEDPESLQESGVMHRNAGEYDQAIADFDRAITLEPNMSSAFYNRGFVYQLQKHYGKAIADYNRAIALRPRYISAINSRGFAYQLSGNYQKAVESYDQALKIQPNYSIALKNRGRAHFYLGHFDEAAKDLQAGLTSDTANTFVVVWLHIAKEHLGEADSAEFAAHVKRTNPVRWPAPVVKLYLGAIRPEGVAAAADSGDARAQLLQRCGAEFYIGEYALWHRDTADAVSRFRKAQSICPRDASEFQGSVAELVLLNKT